MRNVRTYVRKGGRGEQVANDVTMRMRTGAASAVGARRYNENDVIMRTGAVSAATTARDVIMRMTSQ